MAAGDEGSAGGDAKDLVVGGAKNGIEDFVLKRKAETDEANDCFASIRLGSSQIVVGNPYSPTLNATVPGSVHSTSSRGKEDDKSGVGMFATSAAERIKGSMRPSRIDIAR